MTVMGAKLVRFGLFVGWSVWKQLGMISMANQLATDLAIQSSLASDGHTVAVGAVTTTVMRMVIELWTRSYL